MTLNNCIIYSSTVDILSFVLCCVKFKSRLEHYAIYLEVKCFIWYLKCNSCIFANDCIKQHHIIVTLVSMLTSIVLGMNTSPQNPYSLLSYAIRVISECFLANI